LPFIEDLKLEEIVGNVLVKGQLALKNVKTKFTCNVIDPFLYYLKWVVLKLADQWTVKKEILQF